MEDAKIKQAIEHIKEGNSLRSAARKVGESPSLLKYYIDQVTLDLQKGKKGRVRKWDFERALKMREEGMNCVQISKILNVPATTLRKAFSRFQRKENF
jgi:transposase